MLEEVTILGNGPSRLDFEFNGNKYKDYEFLLDDRTNRTSAVLLNRNFMNTMNVMVNPNRKYIITTKFEPKIKKNGK